MAKKKIYRGGVIPYFHDADGQLQLLFMKPSEEKFGGEEFQIAKGKIEDGETAEEGAFREAREELGLFKPNCMEITELGEFMGRTTIFHCRVDDPTKSMFGKPCDETAETAWMTPEEFQASGRGLHKPVVKAAVRSIERILTEHCSDSSSLMIEMFDRSNIDVEVQQTEAGIDGVFEINGKQFVCELSLNIFHGTTIKYANVSLARIVNGRREYSLTNDPDVSPYKIGGMCLAVIHDHLPTNIQAVVFTAASVNGNVEQRFRIYSNIAKNLAKSPRFGLLSDKITTPNGLAIAVYSDQVSDDDIQAAEHTISTEMGGSKDS